MMQLNSETASKVFFNVIPQAAHPRATHTFDGLEAGEGRRNNGQARLAHNEIATARGSASPTASYQKSSRPVSGLASGKRLSACPERRLPVQAQWHSPFVDLAYRCGGSAGLAVLEHHAPASRFIPPAASLWDTSTFAL